MLIRKECEVGGRFSRQITPVERNPGPKKLNVIADLFGVATGSLLLPPEEAN